MKTNQPDPPPAPSIQVRIKAQLGWKTTLFLFVLALTGSKLFFASVAAVIWHQTDSLVCALAWLLSMLCIDCLRSLLLRLYIDKQSDALATALSALSESFSPGKPPDDPFSPYNLPSPEIKPETNL